jgi:DNA-binding CsgD family transcriptional regulator/GAF domain-containing protein
LKPHLVEGIEFMAEDLASRVSSLFTDLGPDPRQNIHAIVSRTCELMSCDGAIYACFEAGSEAVCIRSACSLPRQPLPAWSPIMGLFREVIANGGSRPVCTAYPAGRENRSDAASGPWSGFRSFIGQQVRVGDLPPGVLAALDSRRRDFTESERSVIGLAARALALEEARLQRESALDRRILFEKTLKDMSTMATAVDDPLPFIHRCLEMAGKLAATGGAFLWKLDPRKNKLHRVAGWAAADRFPGEEKPREIAADAVAGSLGFLMDGDILNIADVSAMAAGREREMAESFGLRALLVVPLFSRDEFYGLAGFREDDRPRRWAAEDMASLQTAAEIIMRALENQQLHEELLNHRLKLERIVAKRTKALRTAGERCAMEIESHKRTIATLTEREAELAEKSKALDELNTTLAVLLKRRENDLGELEERVVRNIRDLLDPAINRLKSGGLTDTQRKWLDVLTSNLNELASPFSGKITTGYRRLTPMEIKVASFIKHNKTNKEISDFLGISERTIEVHRNNIRRKLGIKNRKQNLRSFLMSIE